MKSRTKIGIVIVSIFAIQLALAIYWGAIHLILVAISFTFSLLSILLASGEEEVGVNGKKRTVAYFYSRIPGAGHLYLGKRKRSAPFFLAIAVSFFFFYLLTLFPSDTVYLAINFFLILLYASLMSGIDVEKICDDLNIPHTDYSMSIQTSRFYRAYFWETIIIYLPALVTTAYFCLFDWDVDRNVWIYTVTGIAWTSVMIICTLRCLHMKKEGGFV